MKVLFLILFQKIIFLFVVGIAMYQTAAQAEEGNICPKSHPYTDSSDKNYCRQGKKDWGTRLKCPNENNCEDCKSTLFHYHVCYYH